MISAVQHGEIPMMDCQRIMLSPARIGSDNSSVGPPPLPSLFLLFPLACVHLPCQVANGVRVGDECYEMPFVWR